MKQTKYVFTCLMVALMTLAASYIAMPQERVEASASLIVSKAYSKIGSKYRYGASHSSSAIKNPRTSVFDCSSFVSWVYYQSGHSIGVRTTSSLKKVGKAVSYKNIHVGDILVFSGHTGIYVGSGKMIHAPNSKSRVRVEKLSPYWRKRIKTIRRVVNSSSAGHHIKSVASQATLTKGQYRLKSTMVVRKKATTKSKRVGTLKKKTKVTVIKIVNGKWGQIKYKNKVRYISLKYAYKC